MNTPLPTSVKVFIFDLTPEQLERALADAKAVGDQPLVSALYRGISDGMLSTFNRYCGAVKRDDEALIAKLKAEWDDWARFLPAGTVQPSEPWVPRAPEPARKSRWRLRRVAT